MHKPFLKRGEIVTFFIILFSALVFGYWFAEQQIKAVSLEAVLTYPTSHFTLTIFKCTCTILVFFAISQFCLTHISRHKLASQYIALSYIPLSFVWFHLSLSTITLLILILQLLFLVSVLRKNDYRWLCSKYTGDVLALCLIFVLHLFFTTYFSPLHWDMALLLANAQEIPAVATVVKGYELTKSFDFSGIDYSFWTGSMNPPITLHSPLLQLVTFILDLPSISVTSFHIMLSAIGFILLIVGAFGVYLFLKYAAKLHYIFSLLGALLFAFGGTFIILNMLNADGGIFLSSYMVFPYALLFIALAFEKENVFLAVCAGIALAAQFFLYTPHPEGVIYALLFYGVFCGGLFLFSTVTVRQRIQFIGISLATFFMLSSYVLVPLIIDKLFGNLYVFSHINDLSAVFLPRNFNHYVKVLNLFLPLSLLLFFLQKRLTPVYLSTVLLVLFTLIYLLLNRYVLFSEILINILHVGLNKSSAWMRVAGFFHFIVVAIAVMGLDAVAKQSLYLYQKRQSIKIITVAIAMTGLDTVAKCISFQKGK